MAYSVSQFMSEAGSTKPRVFDTYVLPGFMMYFAWKARKKHGMGKAASRMLFGSGLWMALRNIQQYKELAASVSGKVPALASIPKPTGDDPKPSGGVPLADITDAKIIPFPTANLS